MLGSKRSWLVLIGVAVVVLIVACIGVAVVADVPFVAPARSAFHFPWHFLAEEADTMNRCVECHPAERFHTCTSCHDGQETVTSWPRWVRPACFLKIFMKVIAGSKLHGEPYPAIFYSHHITITGETE